MRSDNAGERVKNGVWISSYVNAVSFGVITDVYNDGETARIKHMAQGLCHSGSADPASKQGYAVIAVSPD
jgi:hypothetical protein